MLSQKQELAPNGATLLAVDLLDVEVGTAVVEFSLFLFDAT